MFKKVIAEQEAATRANLRVAHSIARHGKPFTDCELMRDCMIAPPANLFKTISKRCDSKGGVHDIAGNTLTQLSDKNLFGPGCFRCCSVVTFYSREIKIVKCMKRFLTFTARPLEKTLKELKML